MKLFAKSFFSFIFLCGALAQGQSTNLPFQHIIIVVQENRSPDNLFGSDMFASQRQLPGADLVTGGECHTELPYLVALTQISLVNQCDPGHTHEDSWLPAYKAGAMDGACDNSKNANCASRFSVYSYVKGSDVTPYFDIATQYGYANYMFQTNQGPSFPAHQFLLGGTSAPDEIGDPHDADCGSTYPCYEWFAAENESDSSLYGCPAENTVVSEISPAGSEADGYLNGYPCYKHPTLVDLLDANSISWKYYSHAPTTTSMPSTSLWTAPNAIRGICTPDQNGNCTGAEWDNNVASVFPNSISYPHSFSPILTDLGADPNQQQCDLPAVSWVIPDGHWSDHGGEETLAQGPSWVAAIVNAVGGYYYDLNGNQQKTYCWNNGKAMYWGNTAIFITWDDWGGWYDHILPWNCNNTGTCTGFNDGNSGDYVYGFRVPLLAVSPYTGTYNSQTGWSNYISGACGQGFANNCPNEGKGLVHDFGSILNFIEYAFGTGGTSIGQIYSNYGYADHYAPDTQPSCSSCPKYSLADFFDFQAQQARTFTPITNGVNYGAQCFILPATASCFGTAFTAEDPDLDVTDDN